jgi:hypothetical protein
MSDLNKLKYSNTSNTVIQTISNTNNNNTIQHFFLQKKESLTDMDLLP